MILRQFNSSGIEAFRQFLSNCRDNPALAVPRELLVDETLTTAVAPQIEVDAMEFKTRSDAAKYLQALLRPLDANDVARSAGLWTWMSLFYFDQICPAHHGLRDVKNDYTYIFEFDNSRHVYRHLLYVAWHILRLAPEFNRLFLADGVSTLDKFTSETLKKLYITRIPCIFEVLDRIYWDPKRQHARTGMVSPKMRRGDFVHRFPIRIRQLVMTYDLQSLNADQLIELLGDEFKFGRSKHPAATG